MARINASTLTNLGYFSVNAGNVGENRIILHFSIIGNREMDEN